jgi:hypothetical protein
MPGGEHRRIPVGHHQRAQQGQRDLGGEEKAAIRHRRFLRLLACEHQAHQRPVVGERRQRENPQRRDQVDRAEGEQGAQIALETREQQGRRQGPTRFDVAAGIHQADREGRDAKRAGDRADPRDDVHQAINIQ